VGLFSLFKKGKDNAAASDDAAARLAADSEMQRQQAHAKLQRDIARATALKIDAIEAAMEADIFNDAEPAWSPPPRPRLPEAAADADNPATLPLLDAPTTMLLADDEMPAPAPSAATAPVVDESAILYANGQADVAGHLLAGAIADAAATLAGPPAQQDRTPWWLLFDLYQATGQQDAFDNLSIDYASTFETSPPPWRDMQPAAAEAPPVYSGVTPSHVLAATLDARSAAPLRQWRAQAGDAPVLRLDFSRIAACDDAGCAVLLEHLQALVAARRELIVVAAEELVKLLRACICVGRKEDGAATWLLLLELLQLLNREKEFEETSMDYCVTFEVSPPSFTTPYKVETAARQRVAAPSDRFMLPPVIEGNLAPLLAAITAYGAQYHALVFDCSHLARIEFAASGQLLAHVQGLASGPGPEPESGAVPDPAREPGPRRVEFREVNHLVAALMRLMGYTALGRIFAHKY
jgi:ABC-type transporter Mla MlaB component